MDKYFKQNLLFFVAQDVTEEVRLSVRKFINNIQQKRIWTISPPTLIDIGDVAAKGEGDLLDRVLGGILEIYSAKDELPIAIDEKLYEDVEYLIQEIRQFSSGNLIEFEFELNQTFVGAIVNGQMDKSLAIGFLDEWQRGLERRKQFEGL